MANELQIFESAEFGKVRTVVVKDEPWFVASDVCESLGLSNPTVSVNRLDEDERSKFNLGRQGEVNMVNEYGLYNLFRRAARLTRDSAPDRALPEPVRKSLSVPVQDQDGGVDAEVDAPDGPDRGQEAPAGDAGADPVQGHADDDRGGQDGHRDPPARAHAFLLSVLRGGVAWWGRVGGTTSTSSPPHGPH